MEYTGKISFLGEEKKYGLILCDGVNYPFYAMEIVDFKIGTDVIFTLINNYTKPTAINVKEVA